MPAIDGCRRVALDRQQQVGRLVHPGAHLLGLIDERLHAVGQLRTAVGERVGAPFHLGDLLLTPAGRCRSDAPADCSMRADALRGGSRSAFAEHRRCSATRRPVAAVRRVRHCTTGRRRIAGLSFNAASIGAAASTTPSIDMRAGRRSQVAKWPVFSCWRTWFSVPVIAVTDRPA